MDDGRPTSEDAAVVLNALDKVTRAPFTPEQVESLNDYQESGVFHPYTHLRDDGGNEEVLIAAGDGWHCPEHSSYVQDWAWSWSVDGSWRSLYTVQQNLFKGEGP